MVKLVNFHMPADLFEELKRRAAADDRGISKQVLRYVRAGLERDRAISSPNQTK